MLKIFLEKQKNSLVDEFIHVIYFLIDSSIGRINQFLKELCEKHLPKVPIFFILNKVDLMKQDDVQNLAQELFNLNIVNNKGVYTSIANTEWMPNINRCFQCEGNRLLIDNHDKIISCKTCNWNIEFNEIKPKTNIEELIDATLRILPEQQQIAFVSSQVKSLEIKRKQALVFLHQFNKSLLKIGTYEIEQKRSELVAKLSIIYNIKIDINFSILNSLSNGIIYVLGIFKLKFIGEILKSSTKTTALMLYGLLLNKILYENSKKIIDSLESKKIPDDLVLTTSILNPDMIKSMASDLFESIQIDPEVLISPPQNRHQIAPNIELKSFEVSETSLLKKRSKIIEDIKKILNESKEKGTKKKRILCLDGGGMRGLILVEILEIIEEVTNKKIHQLFDMIVGTSTGGILALGLGILKLSAFEFKKIYYDLGRKVFSEKSTIPTFYETKNLESVLIDYFGETKMSQYSPKLGIYPHVCTLSVNANKTPSEPYLFKNYENKSLFQGETSSEVWKAGRATSSAPIYFDPFFDNENVFIDGGLGGNNPSLIAYLEAKSIWQSSEIGCILSIGTGFLPPTSNTGIKLKKFQMHSVDNNQISWLSKITSTALNITIETSSLMSMLNMLLETSTNTSNNDLILKNLLPENIHYIRLNPEIGGVELDETNSHKLLKMRDETIDHFYNNCSDLVKICTLLKDD